jgi:hypothetical protein
LIPYVPAKFKLNLFNCPLCNGYTEQFWHEAADILNRGQFKRDSRLDNIQICFCKLCDKYTIWVDEKMIYPLVNGAPFPNLDMSKRVKDIYEEARGINSQSPRSACALLRLSLEVLLSEVNGHNNKTLFENIGILIEKNKIAIQIQKHMDSLRVTGNDALHPAEIDKENGETKETALQMFDLLNIVAKTLISDPKAIDEFYNSNVSDTQKDAINRRDNSK